MPSAEESSMNVAFPADEEFGDSMHQQMCSRNSDA